jgi:hypothetical protein
MEETSRRQRRMEESSEGCQGPQSTDGWMELFFLKIVTFMRCGETLYSRTGHRTQYGTCALHAGYLRLQTRTHNTYCFPTVTVVIRRRLSVTLHILCLSCCLPGGIIICQLYTLTLQTNPKPHCNWQPVFPIYRKEF